MVQSDLTDRQILGLEPLSDPSEHVPGGLSRELIEFVGEPDQSRASRRRRWRRRSRAAALFRWRYGQTGIKSEVVKCGHSGRSFIPIESRGGRCYPVGVMACGQVWSCPVCSVAIRTRREMELNAAARAWCESGGQLAMLTFTARHDASMSLRSVLTAVLDSYRALQGRTSWRLFRRSVLGSVRALEVTYGANGWHPHLHVLLFVKSGVASLEVEVDRVITDWRELVGASLGAVPSVERAVDLTWFGSDAAAAAGYVSKVAKEIAQADSKSGRDPFALLDDSSKVNAAKWFEYVDAMKGRQSIAWSKGLRKQLGLGVELKDAELADEYVSVEGEITTVVAYVPNRKWRAMVLTGEACAYLQRLEDRIRIEARVVHRE